jgi:hypothetical protein
LEYKLDQDQFTGYQYGVSLETKNRTYPTSGHIPKGSNSKTYNRDTCIPVFIATLFTVAKSWNQSKYSSMGKLIKKSWKIFVIEYYSAIKKGEIMSFSGKWMELEIIMK